MTLLQDVRYACRLLVKDPWFTLVAALALGLGIGLNTTVFTFVNAVLIRGLPFDHPDVSLQFDQKQADGLDKHPITRLGMTPKTVLFGDDDGVLEYMFASS